MPPKDPKTPDPVLEGFPEDGDTVDVGDTPQEDTPEDPPAPPDPDPKDSQIAALQAELAAARRQIAPVEPKAPPQPPADPDPDWDQLLFSSPKTAVKQIVEKTRREVTNELRAEYRREEGTKAFWNKFYAKHPEFDREKDHDLIELTLNSNLRDLANIPVNDALGKLADLTRDRLLRYAGGTKPRGGKKAVAEGAGNPAPRTPAPPVTPSGSIGEVIRNRQKQRRQRGVAA